MNLERQPANEEFEAPADRAAVELNPQPLPPQGDPTAAERAILELDPAAAVELNPQPLPPGENSAAAEELNPKPLPPHSDPAAVVELNPQPLPPQADRFAEG